MPARPVATVIVGGQLIGGSVAVVLLEAPWLMIAVVVTALLALWPARSWRTVREDDPSATEWLVAMGNIVLDGMTSAFLGLVAGGAAWAIATLVDRLDWATPDATTWAHWTAAVVIVLLPAAAMHDDDEMRGPTRDTLTRILPRTQPFELPLRQKAVQGGLLWWPGFVALVGAIGLAWALTGFESTTTKVVWPLAVLLGMSATMPGGATIERNDRYEQIVARLAEALGGAGYEAIVNPVTGDDEVDRSLGDIDILARSEGAGALLVDVRLECPQVNWHEATKLVTAAAVCQRWLDDETKVAPVLVLVDATADDSVADMLGDTGLRVVEYSLPTGTLDVDPEDAVLRTIVAVALDGLGGTAPAGKRASHA